MRALQTLLVRLTGNPQAPQEPGLAGYLKDPQQLISQYAFENGPPLALVVDFDPAATSNALRAAGLPSWGANRPAVLAWWLNESSEGSNLVGDNQASAEPLKRAAQNRGLPLRLPLADLDEQIVGTPENLTAAQPDALRGASERYGADALLAVDAKEVDGKWQAQWRLWMGDSREQGQAEGATPDALADSVMLAAANRLSSRFVATPGAATGLTLQVQGRRWRAMPNCNACSIRSARAWSGSRGSPRLQREGQSGAIARPVGPGAVAGGPGRQRACGCFRTALGARRGGGAQPVDLPLAVSCGAGLLQNDAAGRRQVAAATGKPLILLA
ncbi:hypothetical protein CSC28_4570 [Pseudomonas paraeruginosa]|nr:hypothetical protein CSC28_4570 [Pseudomonas paraeruginosa]